MPNENIENPTPEIPPAEPLRQAPADAEALAGKQGGPVENLADVNDLANRQGGTSPISEPVENFVDANDLANKQGGTSPIPDPIFTPPAENPSSPLYPTDAKALAGAQGGVVKNLLLKAREMIQFRKRKKLEKILELAKQKTTATAGQGKITNNDIQKLLRVSDATATRYLSQLVKEGRLKSESRRGGAFYQLP